MFHNGVGETEDMGTRPLAHARRRCACVRGMGDMVGGGALVIIAGIKVHLFYETGSASHH